MDAQTTAHRKAVLTTLCAGAAVITLTGLGACTAQGAGDDGAGSTAAASSPASPPAAEPTPDPTATARALAAEDATRLPMPQDDIAEWAARTVPPVGSDGYLTGYSGWLSEHSTPRTTSTFQPAPAGSYTLTIACLGGGPLAVSVQELDEQEVGALEHPCDGTVQTLEVVTASPGIRTVLANPVTADPAVYAVAVQGRS